jgi:hypothetical protein
MMVLTHPAQRGIIPIPPRINGGGFAAKTQSLFNTQSRRITMAEKRQSLKTVDGEQMGKGVYHAKFTDGTEFSADLRDLPQTDAEGNVLKGPDGTVLTIRESYDHYPAMVRRTLQYGIKQKLDDSMAGVETVAEAVEELQSTWAAITSGNWTIRVAGEGVEGGLFARAYAEYHSITLAEAKAKIGKLVETNLAANQKAVEGKKDKDGKQVQITERMVFNKLRDVAFERHPDLKIQYDDLKAKRAAKSKSKDSGLQIDLSSEE